MVDEGTEVMPGIGSDIADPDAIESAYAGTPLAAAAVVRERRARRRWPTATATMHMPLLLLTSPQDHVVEPAQSEYLAEHYGGPVERVTLERSYHVATQDYDKELIFERAVAFAEQVTGASATR